MDMGVEAETVRSRVETASVELTVIHVAIGLGLIALLWGSLVVLQEPTVHNAVHDFRHATGITCH